VPNQFSSSADFQSRPGSCPNAQAVEQLNSDTILNPHQQGAENFAQQRCALEKKRTLKENRKKEIRK
jgi:hypothetical protein